MQKEINDIIKERRSIYPREFTGKILDESILAVLLDNANQAPNHKGNYPWRFIIITGEKMSVWLQKAADIYKKETPAEKFKQEKYDKVLDYMTKISHAIAIVYHRDEELKTIETEDICAIGCAVQNMYLSLSQFEHAGGYWSTGLGTYSQEMHSFLNLDASDKLLGYFVLGDIEQKRTEGHKKDFNQFVRYM